MFEVCWWCFMHSNTQRIGPDAVSIYHKADLAGQLLIMMRVPNGLLTTKVPQDISIVQLSHEVVPLHCSRTGYDLLSKALK